MRFHVVIGLFVATCAAAPMWASQLPLVNARVETRPATRGLERELQAVRESNMAAWAAYRVPLVQRPRESMSMLGSRRACRLEPPAELLMLVRFERQQLIELRTEPVDCDLDAGGLPVVWLEGVSPDESVAWLTTLVKTAAPQPRAASPYRSAFAAVALHAAPSALKFLVETARTGATPEVRGSALVWLAQRAADEATATIVEAIDNDPEVAVRKRAVVALGRLPSDEGVPRLIAVATSNRSAEIRRQAMTVLGQSRDPRATEFFAQLLLK